MISNEYESPSVEFLSNMDMADVNAGSLFVVFAAGIFTVAGLVWNVAVVWNWAALAAAAVAVAAVVA
jgi:uncharacterized membrane protein YfcA